MKPRIRHLAMVCLVGAAAATPAIAADPTPAPASELLPAGVEYDPAVPTPESVLGFAPGEWHVRPDQLLAYAEALAATSDRVALEIQGRTHEGRPQPLLVVTSPDNHRRLEAIRAAHLALAEPSLPAPSEAELAAMPVVVWLGYSIHGNEASGANAAPAVAYYLAAGRGPEVEGLLAEAVVLIDPSLNPDGLGRFAAWANSHRGAVPVGDPDHREHRETWPGGRTNHYWFDLNRDWVLLQQPESRNRVATLSRWRPNLLGDFHEMGSDQTYFFQPGVASRQHPLIPEGNRRLTERIAAQHAAALDAAGRLYYSEETFDDFYPGKGSTYPDLTGGVGVLFEEASARGRLMDTLRGPLTFRFAIENQLATSLSMLAAARDFRGELLAYQAEFYRSGLDQARRDPVGGYVFATPGDPARAFHLLELLAGHGVEVHRPAEPLEAGGRSFAPGEAWVVPLAQPQYRLVKALFERRTEFADSTFYDVSAWTLPLAFGAAAAEVDRKRLGAGALGERLEGPSFPSAPGVSPSASEAPYAYVLPWTGTYAPRALYRLLAAGDRPAVATRPFAAETDRGRRSFAAGTLVVPVATAAGSAADLAARLGEIAASDGVEVFAVSTGLTAEGIDLGSPKVVPLAKPKPLLAVGGEVSGYEAGEVWHLLDHRMGVPLPLIEVDRLERLDLTAYTHLLMVDGDYAGLSEGVGEALGRWVRRGGVLVASKRAARWAGERVLAAAAEEESAAAAKEEPAKEAKDAGAAAASGATEAAPVPRRAYADFEPETQAQRITGAIFAVDLDLTHPLAFGYGEGGEAKVAVFRNSTVTLPPSGNPYETVARYEEKPLVAGYASTENLAALAGGPAAIASRLGKGLVVRFADDLNFRAFWYGTAKLYLNALFFGPVVERTEREEPAGRSR